MRLFWDNKRILIYCRLQQVHIKMDSKVQMKLLPITLDSLLLTPRLTMAAQLISIFYQVSMRISVHTSI